MKPSPLVPRRASLQPPHAHVESRLLASWRELDAYVLLGDPGSGKSEALRMECAASDGVFVTARDFITLGVEPQHAGKTLFIDGLDEMRAGQTDGRAPLDAIRAQLRTLGRPSFRLSCREHDWRAQTDMAALSAVAPSGLVYELHLEPLSEVEQRAILGTQPDLVPDPDDFLRRADQAGIAALLGNPLLLALTVRAFVVDQGWQSSRRATIYERACRDLALERSDAHREARPPKPGEIDQLLDDAGLLCAVLLLSGKTSFTRSVEGTPSSIALNDLPAALPIQDARAALASNLFSTANGQTTPFHRSIAEYLAARAVAGRITRHGLPVGRVLALMQGWDGGIVEPLRGLLAWLAVHDERDRRRLIEAQPMSVVLNGDIHNFSTDDKLALLHALRSEAQRNPWFRQHHWVSYPLAPLATPDMAEALATVLADHSTDRAHLALVDCVLDALVHGSPLSELRIPLQEWVEDAAVWFGLRITALEAWRRIAGPDVAQELDWLAKLHRGDLKDQDARLVASLLQDLYPLHVGPKDVFSYWPKPGDISPQSVTPYFWTSQLFEKSRPEDFAALADAWLSAPPAPQSLGRDHEHKRTVGRLLAKALEHWGDQVTDEHLHRWLGMGVDKFGFTKLNRDDGALEVAQWLAQRPERMKAVVVIGWRRIQSDDVDGCRYLWASEQRLHGAARPPDWLHWLLSQAAQQDDDQIAEHCFFQVARETVDPTPGFDVPSPDELVQWVDEHASTRPQLRVWLQTAWTSPLENNWRSGEAQRQRKHEAEALEARETRRKALLPLIPSILDGTVHAHVLHQLVHAFNGRFYDIVGDTPEQRVQDFLVTDEATALRVIAKLPDAVHRSDVPTAEEVMALNAKGKYHYVRPALLLAAQLQYGRDPDAMASWSDTLCSTLVACWLTEGLGETPQWYVSLAQQRPNLVAQLFIPYVHKHLRRKGSLAITGLWELTRDPSHPGLAREALPQILEGFPQRASEAARRELNVSLLSGLHLLDDDTACKILRRKMDHPSIDAAQRISWLVAALPYFDDASTRIERLLVGNQRRVVELGIALHGQDSLRRGLRHVPAARLSHLIELLAPITTPDWRQNGGGWVGPAENRSDTVRALIDLLATDPLPAASDELRRLSARPSLEPWRTHLEFSGVSQGGVAREARYVHPSASAAALTLANAAPANSADLKALVVDHLRDIELHLHGDDTHAVRHFWKEGKADRASHAPRDENTCRDLLLERLRSRLQALGITATPERRAAAEKRVDVAIELERHDTHIAVPIEVKKEDNPQLWIAWRDQLQRLYAINPAAGGHGIYLVLWFGHKQRTSPEGGRPRSPRMLEQALSELIPQEDRARLSVCVLDLSLSS